MDNLPGVYRGIPMRDYHAAAAVNARLVQAIVERCPAAAWHESWMNPERPPERTSGAMDAGSIAHAILLEGSCERVAVIDPNDYPAKTTGAIPEGWTNNAIRLARDNAILAGKIPILKPAFAEVEAMANAAKVFIDGLRSEEPAIHRAFQPDGGDSELTLMWDEAGTLCRVRPDRMNKEHTLIVDYKTTDASAEPNTWARAQEIRMGYYTAAAFYRRGVRARFGTECEYVFLVQEKEPPYLCSLVGMDEQSFALGASKVDYGLNLWRKCAAANDWPTYPHRVCYPVMPAWETARWEEQEQAGIPYEPKKMWMDEKAPAV